LFFSEIQGRKSILGDGEFVHNPGCWFFVPSNDATIEIMFLPIRSFVESTFTNSEECDG